MMKLSKADEVTEQIKEAFLNYPNWQASEKELRELRKDTYYAILSEEEDIDKASAIVEELFQHLSIAYNL